VNPDPLQLPETGTVTEQADRWANRIAVALLAVAVVLLVWGRG
jgi:hypothetical protein